MGSAHKFACGYIAGSQNEQDFQLNTIKRLSGWDLYHYMAAREKVEYQTREGLLSNLELFDNVSLKRNNSFKCIVAITFTAYYFLF